MQVLESRNPSNNAVVDILPVSSNEEIANKVMQAHAAKKAWRALGVEKRVALLRPLVELFKQHKEELCRLTTLEMGKPITECLDGFSDDLFYFEDFLNQGPRYIQDEVTVNEGNVKHRIVYEPRGVTACIAAWNYPLSNFLWSVMPNLIVGNTVVFKHSEECPLFGRKVEEIIQQYGKLPQGVFSEIYGDGQVGMELVNQPIDLIWFVGSSAVGKKLAEIAGRKKIKAVLEMGGSNPAIIFADADLETAVAKVFSCRYTNCGQICDAIKRVIIHESLHDQFILQLSKRLAEINIGDPLIPSTQMGPLVAMRQLTLLEAQVQDAVQSGAKIIVGGKRPADLNGAYYLPTILTNIKPEMRVWHEEVFGPVLPIMTFKTNEEAIQLANDTIYGLGSVIFTKDKSLAARTALELEAGFVEINQASHWRPCNPFGGHKASGMGCEHGRLGFHELCLFKVIAEE